MMRLYSFVFCLSLSRNAALTVHEIPKAVKPFKSQIEEAVIPTYIDIDWPRLSSLSGPRNRNLHGLMPSPDETVQPSGAPLALVMSGDPTPRADEPRPKKIVGRVRQPVK